MLPRADTRLSPRCARPDTESALRAPGRIRPSDPRIRGRRAFTKTPVQALGRAKRVCSYGKPLLSAWPALHDYAASHT